MAPTYENVIETYDLQAGGEQIKEAVADVITNVAPRVTPFFTLCGKGPTARNRYNEWEEETLEDPQDNAQPESKRFDPSTRPQPNRIGNYTQISDKEISVSGTAQAVDVRGKKSELGHQLVNAGIELRRDMEFGLTSRFAATPGTGNNGGNDGTVRRSCGLPLWLRRVASGYDTTGAANKTIDGEVVGSLRPTMSQTGGGANELGFHGYVNGTGTVGDARALTVTALLDLVEELHDESEKEMWYVLLLPKLKRKLTAAMLTNANVVAPAQRQQQGKVGKGKFSSRGVTMSGAVRVYETDFGDLHFITDRYMGNGAGATKRDVPVIDDSMFDISYVKGRRFMQETPGKVGDSKERGIRTEYMLRCRSDRTSANLAGINPALEVTA